MDADETPRRRRQDVEMNLYNLIVEHKYSPQTVAGKYIEFYTKNQDGALLCLLQLIVSASGTDGKITPEMLATQSPSDILKEMFTPTFEETEGYPLMKKSAKWKKTQNNFSLFLMTVVKKCPYPLLCYENLIPKFLIEMSKSKVQAFRHTATFAALKIITSLVDVIQIMSEERDNRKREYERRKQRAGGRESNEHLQSLRLNLQEMDKNLKHISSTKQNIFKAVFTGRRNDVIAGIRIACMAELGVWMMNSPEEFLNPKHLEFIDDGLRTCQDTEEYLTCLEVLQSVYGSEVERDCLKTFARKCKDIIISYTLHKNLGVAVQAINVVIAIHKKYNDVLTEREKKHMYKLVFSRYHIVGCAAGKFLMSHINTRMRADHRRESLLNTPVFMHLAKFLHDFEKLDLAQYLVDSLFEANRFMQDWRCMTHILLEEAWNNELEMSLIEIMVCCVKQAATGEQPSGREHKQVLSNVQKRQAHDEKLRLTEHFMRTLPKILEKYKNEPNKLSKLLVIPQYFELGSDMASRDKENLELLLQQIVTTVGKYHDADLLKVCAKTLYHLCTMSPSCCDPACTNLINDLVYDYKDAVDKWHSHTSKSKEDEGVRLIQSLKKVTAFYHFNDLNKYDIWDHIFKELERERETVRVTGDMYFPAEVVKYFISAAYCALLWELQKMKELLKNNKDVTNEHQVLKSRLQTFMDETTHILLEEYRFICKEEAYLRVCDLMVTVCGKPTGNPALVEVHDGLAVILKDFLNKYAFIDGAQDEASTNKRLEYLTAFCKLIVYNAIPFSSAADVFMHYGKFNKFDDVIIELVKSGQKIDMRSCVRAVIVGLENRFTILLGTRVSINRNRSDFSQLKDVAKKFAELFTSNAIMIVGHYEGIKFATAVQEATGRHPNIAFFDLLDAFITKLPAKEKKDALKFLELCVAKIPQTEDLEPCKIYRKKLDGTYRGRYPYRKSRSGSSAELLPRSKKQKHSGASDETEAGPSHSSDSATADTDLSRSMVGMLQLASKDTSC